MKKPRGTAMLFNSFAYIFFLPVVFVLYWLLPHKYRWFLLLAASCYFYMSWNPKYIFLILGVTAISYCSALALEKSGSKGKKIILLFTAVACLGTLFLFKYFNFFLENLCRSLELFSIRLNPVTLRLILPVGISFYTFQALSYVIDVYRGDIRAERHFGYYAAFITFFPQLVAGPIERTSHLLPQIKSPKSFEEPKAMDGLKMILWGYFKKMVVADTLALYVDKIYGGLESYNGLTLAIAAFFFVLQIYCDFSGYSSIAIGTSKLMGIDLTTNFASPYFSTSIKEFWRRWHISLSSWFRDYVYIPLGGSRCHAWKRNRNLFLTFLLSGFWHGADWTFLVWGGLHGIAQILENTFHKPIEKIKQHKAGLFISWLVVFAFWNFTMIFFRASNIGDALYVLTHMLNGISSPMEYIHNGYYFLGIDKFQFLYLIFLIFILSASDYSFYKKCSFDLLHTKSKAVEWGLYIALGVIVVLFSQKGVAAEFVYFQF